MKTHDLAKALTHFGRVLRAGPNVDFEQLTNLSTYLSTPKTPRSTRDAADKVEADDKATGLALLAQMASYSKAELLDLAREMGIPIEVRKADGVRDVMGKLLKYLQDHPEIRDRLSSEPSEKAPARTSSLAKALAILMNQP